MKNKILIVFGTRPEAIKMAPLVKELQKYKTKFNIKVCVTGQHREMLEQVLRIFEIKPDYNLDIMKDKQDLYDVTVNILIGMKKVLLEYKPSLVFVHGDTSTTFATSLASFYLKVNVAHIEAGLRTYNIYSPWPEEANRQLTSKLTKYHFTPTKQSRRNLLNEKVNKNNIFITGNTVIDALFWVLNKIDSNVKLEKSVITQIENLIEDSTFKLESSKIILVTGHRRENFGQGFINICEALKKIALNNPNIVIVYPVHLNPNVQEPVRKVLSDIKNIFLIEPLTYESFIYLMSKSYLVLTDSGGVQEEAPSLGKPVLVMRDTTERPEAIEAGTVKLVGVDKSKIISEVQKLIDNEVEYKKMSKAHNPYGNGKACEEIVKRIIFE